ncbi:uncharacterized protein [Linepithema humile]|uniref:uncharacterized protein n=1 Tax=Linepithema humile TaxID=83485 RepID=UPI000623270A|nr:PREDICTED: uncharacterized protein LOC105670501 [Linepithema humile]
MAETLNDSIKKLRKKSRTLLAHVDENSKRVNAEVKKLRSQTLSLINYHNHKSQDCYLRKNSDIWKLRNDSSEISAVLCPDFCDPQRATTSAPNMISSAKLTLTSRKPKEECSRIISRKPVKDCYCYSKVNEMHLRSSRTLHKPTLPCCNCRSLFEFKPIKETDDKTTLTSPISCETFRRVQKIDYTPRSQFLRNVQNKVCELRTGGQGDCVQTCPGLSNYCRFITNARLQDISNEKLTLPNERKHVDEKQKSPNSPTVPANSLASEQHDSDRDNVTCVFNRRAQASAQKLSKSTLRKTIRSRKYQQILESSQRSKSPIQNKKAMQLLKQDYPCRCMNELEKETKRVGKHKLSEYYDRRDRCSKHDDGSAVDDTVNQEVEDLRKFREQNYFETHGSNYTLASSRSSGSLQQYFLNERLFPEPIGRIHRQDLVVTMPPCATTQKKRIHCFPRYVIRQEKKVCNTSYRRKRCQSCPLTGHAIDLGILKTRPLLNSLALKYQKQIP